MKIRISFLALLALGVASACTTAKTPTATTVTYLLLLTKDQDAAYLTRTYATYHLAGVKPANRTLNQYRATFTGTADQEKDLQQQLAADPNVLEFKTTTTDGVKVQSGTNQQSTKTKPIKQE